MFSGVDSPDHLVIKIKMVIFFCFFVFIFFGRLGQEHVFLGQRPKPPSGQDDYCVDDVDGGDVDDDES